MVLSTLRHQRDLFSGGVPVNTRVGSVVHAFENLAFQRQLKEGAEKPYESSKSSSSVDKKDSIYKINLPTTATGSAPLIVRHKAKKKGTTIDFFSSNYGFDTIYL